MAGYGLNPRPRLGPGRGIGIQRRPTPSPTVYGGGGVNYPGVWDSFMPEGASMTAAGDIGERRQRESVAVGGFKDGETVRASSVFKR